MRRWQLSKKERRILLQELKLLYPRLPGELLEKNRVIEYLVENNIEMVLIDRIPAFIKTPETIIPHLKLLLKKSYKGWLPYIVVDEGAVGPISRGAALMRPGILEIKEPFEKDSIVVIVEPSKNLPLAIHKSLYSSNEIIGMSKGKVTEALHHLGDKYWRLADKV